MTIKKILITLLSLVFVFAVSCSNDNLDPNASAGGGADLIDVTDGTIAQFIKTYAGVYYNQNQVKYKLKGGKLYTPHNKEVQVQAVSVSQKKMQIKYAEAGKIEVLNFTDKGYISYTSFILEKVSSEVAEELKDKPVGGYIKEFAQYKGTYNSVAAENKIENYIAIDGEGNIYFHDKDATVANKRVGITENELTIIELQKNRQYRKIIFKFGQSVYREYNLDGKHVETTGEGFTRTKDFIDDLGNVQYTGSFNTDKEIRVTFTANGDSVISWPKGGGLFLAGDMNDNAVRIGNTVKIMRNGVTLTINGNNATYKDDNGNNIALTKKVVSDSEAKAATKGSGVDIQ